VIVVQRSKKFLGSLTWNDSAVFDIINNFAQWLWLWVQKRGSCVWYVHEF